MKPLQNFDQPSPLDLATWTERKYAARRITTQQPGAVAIQKHNGSRGAILCSVCYVILRTGFLPADTPPQYCPEHAPEGHQNVP